MATVIGLCVSYKGLSEEHIVLSQNSSETNGNMEQLKANHDLLTADLMKLQSSFQEAVRAKDSMQLVRNRERQGKELLQRQKEALVNEETQLRTRITALEKSCERCPVGWELLRSSCYFFPPTESGPKLSWHRSREECKKSGADLAVIDSQEKQDKERVLKAARTKGKVLYNNVQDLSAGVHRMQRGYDEVRKKLRNKGIHKHRIIFPARVLVTHNERSHTFQTPAEVDKFVQSL
ncbi:hypothetical protein SKAU_G00338700 [Synaphobranchus kaupii]|uniref:Uncharacterized protein n=1 Tax=Synaphobranchus kaupii TaxID=118154 RepID=A0A9Q1IJB2_SYNKA|nr:hypothetical protein SKAU_G00338700 [Synaphobranchus kaupii]